MPKQMDAGISEPAQQRQQSQSDVTTERRAPKQDIAETADQQMRPVHFSDWAAI
jgi:hypothetical protein